MELQAKCTIFAEGCRGHLSNFIMEKVSFFCNPELKLQFSQIRQSIFFFFFSILVPLARRMRSNDLWSWFQRIMVNR